jgi:hypothetical protein
MLRDGTSKFACNWERERNPGKLLCCWWQSPIVDICLKLKPHMSSWLLTISPHVSTWIELRDGWLIERDFRHNNNNNKSASMKKRNPNPIKKKTKPKWKLRSLINSEYRMCTTIFPLLIVVGGEQRQKLHKRSLGIHTSFFRNGLIVKCNSKLTIPNQWFIASRREEQFLM